MNGRIPGEDPAPGARMPFEVGELRLFTTFEPMIGMVTSPHHVFITRGARRVAEPVERDEGNFEWVPVARLRDLIASGHVKNSGTLVGLLAVIAEP